MTSRRGFGSHVSEGVRQAGVSVVGWTKARNGEADHPPRPTTPRRGGRGDRSTVATDTGRAARGSHINSKTSEPEAARFPDLRSMARPETGRGIGSGCLPDI